MAKQGKEKLSPDQPYAEAIAALIAERWSDVWKAVPAAIDGDDIEGVHAVRVASRRLRAAMDVAADCFPTGWYKPLHGAAKEITGALGAVRDRDVLLEFLAAERASVPAQERPGLDRLIAKIEGERNAARAKMTAFFSALSDRGIEAEAARRFAAAGGGR